MNTTILGVDTTIWIAVGIVIVALIVVAGIVISRRRRSGQLQARFGPEYARAIDATGDKRHAEAELAQRSKRVQGFDIRPLSATDRERYVETWRRVQARFVDNPADAVTLADDTLSQVMASRGYPMTDFDQRSADISVDHPMVVQNYRAAHDIAVRQSNGEASTEDLRQAMIHYRGLFDELVTEPGAVRATAMV